MSQADDTTGFSPYDLTDGRVQGNWKSRYVDEAAQKEIKWERNYLIVIFCSCLVLSVLIGILLKNFSTKLGFDTTNISNYFFAWAGGTLGGTLFSAKWLIHTIAKNTWNIDRQIWRIFTPHLSASLALVFIVLINSEMINIATPKSLTIHKCFGIGFLVGYFSDNAIGKLTELAQVVFGSGLSHKK
ncbi:MAG: hypothetical protein NT007_17470 [Candidatus Kapabacteria bacterium]|nr:hypothetical protein [Candidatus Kapabacteria bacterium]